MLKVFKYVVPARLGVSGAEYNKEFELKIPDPGRILSFGLQPSRSRSFQVWALVDPGNKPKTRRFVFMGTGHQTERQLDELHFIDRWISDGLVFHLFEIYKPTGIQDGQAD